MLQALAIGGSLLGGLLGKSSADKAAKAQVNAANQQAQVARETRDMQMAALAPYERGGQTAFNALMSANGLGPAPVIGGTAPQIETVAGVSNGGTSGGRRFNFDGRDTSNMSLGEIAYMQNMQRDINGGSRSPTRYRVNGQMFNTMEEAQAYANANATGGQTWGGLDDPGKYNFELGDWTTDPGYQFRMDEGSRAVESGAAMRHGLGSGAAMKALTEFGQNFGSNEFGNVYNRRKNEYDTTFGANTDRYNTQYNRLAGLAGMGQNSAAGQASATQQYGTNMLNVLGNKGNAQSAGIIGGANAITGGINNALGTWAYGNEAGWWGDDSPSIGAPSLFAPSSSLRPPAGR